MRRAFASLAFTVVAGFAAACGDSTSDGPEGTAPIAFDMVVSVAPGQEIHSCQFVKMPETSGEIFVGGGEYDASPGTHHFLVFRTAADTPEQPLGQPIDCYEGEGVMQYERGYVTGGQLAHESGDFPPGLGLPFQPGELLLMQMHVVNAGASSVDAKVHVELRTVEGVDAAHRVGTFRFYDPFIYLPAGGAATASMRCHIHHDVTLLSAGSHMHSRGVAYRAFADIDATAPSAEPFYTTTDWQHPKYWLGILELPAGSALRYECDYQNSSDAPVVQGLSAIDDEMCMLSGFYFPAQDEGEEECESMDLHGTGDRSCAQTTSCIQLCDPAEAPHFDEGSAEVGECFQKCIADSCPNVTETLFPQLSCTVEHCDSECTEYGAACTACVVDHCKSELDACQALACG